MNDRATNPRRVLIIDDTRAIHDDFRKILGGEGPGSAALERAEAALFGNATRPVVHNRFTLDSAYQGQQGLELVQAAARAGARYEMAFVDIRMPPGWDGVETVAKLWEADPDLQVVICTAYSDYSWKDMVEKLGQSDRLVILKKPFDTIEVLQLANAMTEKWRLLQATRRKLDELEQLVAERTRHLKEANGQLQEEIEQRKRREGCLGLQSEVTRVLVEATETPEETTVRILQIICEAMGWDVGGVWMVDRPARVLRCATIWHPNDSAFADFNVASQFSVLPLGRELPGKVWETGEPLWIPDIACAPGFALSALAAKAGLHAAFGFPLRLRGDILGVLEFHGRQIRQPENDMLQLFAALGSQIGQSLDRRKLEEELRQSQKMEAVGKLAGGLAHDFNNILTVIQMEANMLRSDGDLLPEQLEAAGDIETAAQRAANLVRQLLAFSCKQVMQTKVLDLNQAVKRVSELLRRTIGEHLDVQFQFCAEPTVIRADENMLNQVLINLTLNARDALPEGGHLLIRTESVQVDTAEAGRHPGARAGDFVGLTVNDSGCGISPDHLPHIFEPFYSTKEVGKGTGLGLSTVYGIVQQHQGWIEVSSRVGVGTEFRIYFPKVADDVPAPVAGVRQTALVGGRETILLVEDEAGLRRVALQALQRAGYTVLEAASGLQALNVWDGSGGKVDLLFTDLMMPGGVNGRELARRLQQKQPGLKIVYTSGYSAAEISGGGDRVWGGSNFLGKPYDPHSLLQMVRHILDRP